MKKQIALILAAASCWSAPLPANTNLPNPTLVVTTNGVPLNFPHFFDTNAATIAAAVGPFIDTGSGLTSGVTNQWRRDATNAAMEIALAVAGSNTAGVASFNARVGAVVLTSNDVGTALGYVPSSNTGTFTGTFVGDGSGLTNVAGGTNGGLMTFQGRTNAAAVLTLADVTTVGGAPATNAILYDINGTQTISSYNGRAQLINPTGSGNYGNMFINDQAYMKRESNGELKVGSLSEFTLAGGGTGASVSYGGNTYGTMISPMFVGSGAGLTDARPYGPEIWVNQPLPVFLWSFYSVKNVTEMQHWWPGETNAKAVALFLKTNNIFTATTNYGIRNPIMLNGFWIQTNRTDAGGLLASTTNYPSGITNTVDYIRQQGSEVWLDFMYASRTPEAPYTAMIADVGTGIWYGDAIGTTLYSNGAPVSWPTTMAAQPMMTANTVKADIKKMYEWGIEGIMVLDQGNPVAWPANSVGYRNQMQQQVAHAVNYAEADSAYGVGEYYAWWSQPSVAALPNRYQARHPMSITMWQPHALHDPIIPYSCNNMGFDTGSNDETSPGARITGASFAFSQVSYPISWLTNFPDWSTHFMFQQMEWEGNDFYSWGTNDWQAVFGMQAVWHATLQLSYPFDYVTNGWWQQTFTNSTFLALLADKGQHAVHLTRFGTNDSIFWNNVSSETDARMVLFSNTKTNSNTSTNLTITWAELGINTNLVCKVSDVWSGADLGEHTNTITLAVSNSATRFFTMSPVRFQGTSSGGDVTLAMLQGATNTDTLIDQGLLGTSSGLDGTHIAPGTVSTNVFDTNSWNWLVSLEGSDVTEAAVTNALGATIWKNITGNAATATTANALAAAATLTRTQVTNALTGTITNSTTGNAATATAITGITTSAIVTNGDTRSINIVGPLLQNGVAVLTNAAAAIGAPLNGTNVFTGTNTFTKKTVFSNDVEVVGSFTVTSTNDTTTVSNLTATGTITGNGSGLTNVATATTLTGSAQLATNTRPVFVTVGTRTNLMFGTNGAAMFGDYLGTYDTTLYSICTKGRGYFGGEVSVNGPITSSYVSLGGSSYFRLFPGNANGKIVFGGYNSPEQSLQWGGTMTSSGAVGYTNVQLTSYGTNWPAQLLLRNCTNGPADLIVLGTATAASYATATNSWALNTAIPFGTNALVLVSGAATGGIIGISMFPTATEGNLGLLVKATGDIVFTNVPGFVCSDFLASRTITNGNFARIGITLTPGVCTNMDIVQYR